MSRLVEAWVRMCPSSPICRPWPASESTSTGPLRRTAAASTGPATPRRKRSRSTASGASTPYHGVLPGPWLRPEKARLDPERFSTAKTGAEGPRALAIGTTAWWWLAGSNPRGSRPSPRP
jgi:hypothetical protein